MISKSSILHLYLPKFIDLSLSEKTFHFSWDICAQSSKEVNFFTRTPDTDSFRRIVPFRVRMQLSTSLLAHRAPVSEPINRFDDKFHLGARVHK